MLSTTEGWGGQGSIIWIGKWFFLSLQEIMRICKNTGTALKCPSVCVASSLPPPPSPLPQTFEIISNEYQIFTRGRDCHEPPVTESHLRLDYCSSARRPGVCGVESSPHLLCVFRHSRRGRTVTVWLQKNKNQRNQATQRKLGTGRTPEMKHRGCQNKSVVFLVFVLSGIFMRRQKLFHRPS